MFGTRQRARTREERQLADERASKVSRVHFAGREPWALAHVKTPPPFSEAGPAAEQTGSPGHSALSVCGRLARQAGDAWGFLPGG